MSLYLGLDCSTQSFSAVVIEVSGSSRRSVWITPYVPTAGVRRFDLDPSDAARNVRAVVEGQMMAIANYSTSIAPVIRRVVDTGGGSANRAILQVMADVFGASVFPLETTNTACLGAALRAYHADRLADGEALPWRDVGRGFTDPRFEDAITPVAAHVPIYAEMRRLYERRASATASSRT